MGLSVQYAETFEITFQALTDFIHENWGDKVVTDFVKETEKVIDLITSSPECTNPVHLIKTFVLPLSTN